MQLATRFGDAAPLFMQKGWPSQREGHPFVQTVKAQNSGRRNYAFLVVTTAGVAALAFLAIFLPLFAILVDLALVAANAGVVMIPPSVRASSEAAKMRRGECFVCMAISFR